MGLRKALSLLPITLLMAAAGLPAHADGDDYFKGVVVPLTDQLVFVGSVKDESGAHVKGARVTWRVRTEEAGGGQELTAGTYTDLLGRYRTVDVKHAAATAGLSLVPTAVDVTVTKPGYTQVKRLRRAPTTQTMGLIEVDFVVAKTKSGAKG